MKIGQMSFKSVTEKADYLQLDMCGLNRNEVCERYLNFNKSIYIILYGDWSKKGCSENNIIEKKQNTLIRLFNLKILPG